MDQEGQQRLEEEKEGKGSEGYAGSELGGGKLGNFGSSIPTTTFSLFKLFFSPSYTYPIETFSVPNPRPALFIPLTVHLTGLHKTGTLSLPSGNLLRVRQINPTDPRHRQSLLLPTSDPVTVQICHIHPGPRQAVPGRHHPGPSVIDLVPSPRCCCCPC